jgi:protease-4
MRVRLLFGAGALLVSLFASPAFSGDTSQAGKAPAKEGDEAKDVVWGHIEIKGSYPEGTQLPGLFSELSEGLDDALARFDKAAGDANLSGLVLRINGPSIGWAKANSLRQAIAKVRAKGKRVTAYLEDAGTMDYVLATACDEIVMPESGVVTMLGLRAEVEFYKKLFDMVGIKADMLRVGEFKSAAEPYTRSEMSPEFRQELEELLDDRFKLLTETIAASRKMPVEKVAAAIDDGPYTAKQAHKMGLVDRLAYFDDVEAGLEKQAAGGKFKLTKKYGKKKLDTDFSGFTGMMKMMELLMGVEPTQRKSNASKLGIIHAVGPIYSGASGTSFLSGESTIGSDTMVKAIRQAAEDKTVKAIVMRVDSPGGSALASDLIWREVEQAKTKYKKPFVVSMGDVAGSGGYYIAMGADKIYAEPGTITGSIGVIGGKLALQGLWEKIGITTTVISRGKNSGALSGTTPFTDSERAAMQKLLNEIYDQFTAKAAQGRKMEQEKLEKLARGRIYSGNRAREIGLIDEIGTLDDAIAAAKKLAGLNPEDKLEKLNLPKPTSPFEQLFGPLDASAKLNADSQLLQTLREAFPDLATRVQHLHLLQRLAREPGLTLMPFRITIR